MTKNRNISPAGVRAWLARNARSEARTMAQIYDGLGAQPGIQRRKIRVWVRYEVASGCLTRSETTDSVSYQLPKVGPVARAARVANQAANTPAPAGRRRDQVISPKLQAETVDDFVARGGKVEILSTHWGLAA
jgi:hypothetical protein